MAVAAYGIISFIRCLKWLKPNTNQVSLVYRFKNSLVHHHEELHD